MTLTTSPVLQSHQPPQTMATSGYILFSLRFSQYTWQLYTQRPQRAILGEDVSGVDNSSLSGNLPFSLNDPLVQEATHRVLTRLESKYQEVKSEGGQGHRATSRSGDCTPFPDVGPSPSPAAA